MGHADNENRSAHTPSLSDYAIHMQNHGIPINDKDTNQNHRACVHAYVCWLALFKYALHVDL